MLSYIDVVNCFSWLNMLQYDCRSVGMSVWGGVIMATSSITKDFFIHDFETYNKLINEISVESKEKEYETDDRLEEGEKLLKHFLFR